MASSIGRTVGVGMFVGALLCPVSTWAQTYVDFQPGIRLGQGFETIDDSVRGECVAFDRDTGELSTAQGQSGTYYMYEVSDSYQLTEAMKLSLSARYKSMYGTSAEGKTSIARDRKISQFDSTFIVRMSVQNPWQSLVKAKLTDSAAALAKASPADFRQRCGNHFVSAVLTGGEFIGFVSASTRNQSEQEAVTRSFTGTWGLSGSASVSADQSKDFLETIENKQLTLRYQRSGGTVTAPRSIDDMFAALQGFATEVRAQGAVPYQASLQSYTTLPNYPTSADLGQKELGLSRIVERALRLRSIREDLDYIRTHRQQFSMKGTPADLIPSLTSQVDAAIRALEASAATCRSTGTCPPPEGPLPEDVRERLPPRYRSVCDPVDLKLDPLQIDAFRRTKGDGEMDGHSPTIKLRVALAPSPSGKDLKLTGSLVMREAKSDWTTFESEPIDVVVQTLRDDARESCRYAADQQGLELAGSIDTQSAEDEHEYVGYGGNGILLSAECRADTRGNDTGKLGCRKVQFRPIRLRLAHEEDFMDATARRAENARRIQRLKSLEPRAGAAPPIARPPTHGRPPIADAPPLTPGGG